MELLERAARSADLDVLNVEPVKVEAPPVGKLTLEQRISRAERFHARRGVSLARAQIEAALWLRKRGADLRSRKAQEMIAVGFVPAMGGAVGSTPAATFSQVPADQFFVMAPEVFDEATIRNVWQSKQQALPAFAQSDGFDLPGRGLLVGAELVLTATSTNTAGTGTITYTDYWPYGILDNLKFSVNGSPLLNAQGTSYNVRRQVVTRNAPDSMTSAPTAAGANVVEVHYVIPIADNLVNLWGAIVTQSDDLYARLDYTVASQAKIVVLTGNATQAFTAANLQISFIAYDIPIVPIANVGDRGVLPDTDVLHRFSEFSVPIVANGDTELRLQQTAGEIERILLFADNVGSLLDPASWNTVRFQFAETEEPQVYTAHNLLAENARNYLGRVGPAPGKVAVIDFAYWNQRRDALYPKGVANPKVILNLPATITPNVGARFYAVQESLVGAA